MPVANVRSKWSAGDLIFYESVAGNGAMVEFGEDASGLDVKLFGATTGKYLQWDESADTLINTGGSQHGVSGTGVDITFYGDTAGTYMRWDASADSLLIPGTAGKFQIGAFTGATSGTGSVVSATNTAPFKVFADDGGAAIGSGSLVRAGWFRNLQTYTTGNREQESAGVQGSIMSVAGTNRHNMCGVLGSYEARTSLTVGGQAAATDTWCQAGVIGRVGMSTGTLVVDTNAVLAGLAAMSNINTACSETWTGAYTGFYVGAWANANDWRYGLYIEKDKVATAGIYVGSGATHGILVGEDDAGSDVKFYGATASDYWEWDESLDKMVIEGQAHIEDSYTVTDTRKDVLRINSYPTHASGKSSRGLMVLSEGLAGTGGVNQIGITAISEMDSTKRITGFLTAITASLINAADATGGMGCIEMTWKNTATAPGPPGTANHAYMIMRDYGTNAIGSLFWFGDITVGSASNSALICEMGNATTCSHVIRFMVKNVPYWIMCDSTPPV